MRIIKHSVSIEELGLRWSFWQWFVGCRKGADLLFDRL